MEIALFVLFMVWSAWNALGVFIGFDKVFSLKDCNPCSSTRIWIYILETISGYTCCAVAVMIMAWNGPIVASFPTATSMILAIGLASAVVPVSWGPLMLVLGLIDGTIEHLHRRRA